MSATTKNTRNFSCSLSFVTTLHSRYAEMVANRDMRRTTLMILGAWCMALVISLPVNIDAPGFVNFNVTDDLLKTEAGFCAPPVAPDCKGSIFSFSKF